MSLSLTYLTDDKSTATVSAYTYSALSLGAADSTRRIIVCAYARENSAGVTSLPTSVTVGGVSASKLSEQDIPDVPASDTSSGVAIWSADVPTGTTGDVVVTYGGTQLRAAVSIYRLVSSASGSEDTDTDSEDGGNSLSTSLTVSGTAVHAAVIAVGGGGSVSWVGPTEDVEAVIQGTIYTSASGTSATALMTPTNTPVDMAMVSVSFVEAADAGRTRTRTRRRGRRRYY